MTPAPLSTGEGDEMRNSSPAGAAPNPPAAETPPASGEYKSTTGWGLRDAVVGSPVFVRGSLNRHIQYVAAAVKTKVTLQDGTQWSRAGKPWGSGGDRAWRRDSADIITDLDAVKRELHEERQQKALNNLRWEVRTRCTNEVKWLDGKSLAAIVAILDATKSARESNERSEGTPS